MAKKKSLKELWDHTESQINTYRAPNLEEFKRRFDPIIAALGEGSLEYERIESLYEGQNYFRISTSYSVRSCNQSRDITIPREVVLSPFPELMAALVAATKKYDNASTSLLNARRQVNDLTQKLVELRRIKQTAQAQLDNALAMQRKDT